MFLGGLLLLMQLHGYQHSQYPDDFPLNADDHSHIHEDMAKSESPLSGYKKPLNLGAEPDAGETHEPEMHTHDGEDYHSH
jgi:hypothetical protein